MSCKRQSVSIALAACNGEKYIEEQLDSIIAQMQPLDELVISLDPSRDGTEDICRQYAKEFSNVRVVLNHDHSKGLVSNFENALRNCNNEIILYSDQDDVWLPGKIDAVCQVFEDPCVSVVIHDAKLVDEKLNEMHESTFELRGGVRTSFFGNLFRLSYIGCCMAFRKKYMPAIMPIATIKRSHDWWTGSICSLYGKMAALDTPYILHRVHSSNATNTTGRGIRYKLAVRIRILVYTCIRKLMIKLA